MQLGIKGQIHNIYSNLQKIRNGTMPAPGQLAGMRDITLTQYLGAQYKEGCTGKDGQFDTSLLYQELGVNPNQMTVEALIDLDQDSKWLVPEIFRDAIRKGFRTSPFYNNLIAESVTVPQPQVNMPYVDLSDAEPKETAEGETISKGSITYGNKVVNIKKHAIGIDITYEAIQYTTLNLLNIFIQDVGVKLGHKLNTELINIAINGDQEGGSEAAAVIGVDNVNLGLQYSDILRVWIRGSLLGRVYDTFIMNEAMAGELLQLEEFKKKEQGTTLKGLTVNGLLPNQANIYVSTKVPANQIIMVDTRFAFVQLNAAPLLVEGERIVSKQIQGTYASITAGFANVFREARVILDKSIPYVGNEFPAWMAATI